MWWRKSERQRELEVRARLEVEARARLEEERRGIIWLRTQLAKSLRARGVEFEETDQGVCGAVLARLNALEERQKDLQRYKDQASLQQELARQILQEVRAIKWTVGKDGDDWRQERLNERLSAINQSWPPSWAPAAAADLRDVLKGQLEELKTEITCCKLLLRGSAKAHAEVKRWAASLKKLNLQALLERATPEPEPSKPRRRSRSGEKPPRSATRRSPSPSTPARPRRAAASRKSAASRG